MRTVLKWIGILLVGLLSLVVVALVAVYLITEQRLNRVYEIAPEMVPISQDGFPEDRKFPEVVITFCRECHGQNLAGQVLEDDPMVGRLVAPNLTSGKGGIGAKYIDEDWVRALRHGVGQDGKSLIVMPSNIFYNFSDEDLGYVIAAIKNAPPIDNELPETRLGPGARFFILQEPFLLTATIIDHTGPRPEAPTPGLNVEYGKYLSMACVDCHGEDFAGGEQVGAGLNLTRGGELANWTEGDFIETIRTGIAPDGKKLDLELMPTRVFGKFSDQELKAIFLYIQSLPAVETTPQPQS